MKDLDYLNEYRLPHPLNNKMGDNKNGYFKVGKFHILASNGGGWEHVSVSTVTKKIPSWNEMVEIKKMFYEDHETVVQFHPKESEYINNASYVLHLWKKIDSDFDLPPSNMVGIKCLGKIA